jgi:hypothetical protein
VTARSHGPTLLCDRFAGVCCLGTQITQCPVCSWLLHHRWNVHHKPNLDGVKRRRPLRKDRSEAEASALVESMIKTLRDGYGAHVRT